MSLQQVWEALKEAIVAYTPATFFTLLALFVATYYHVLFEPSDARHRPTRLEEEMQPPHDGKTTDEELMEPDPNKALVIGRDASAAGSSSPDLTCTSCPYDVFLSFRGTDTRKNFTGHLYTYLVHKGISTFIDSKKLRKGDDLSSSLIKAIQGAKISILILSENYASSSWCLDELVEILECMKLKQQLVWPVFYKVDPSDVRHQKGKYGEAFAKHVSRYNDNIDKVERWRKALTEASNLLEWTFFQGDEASFISNIAEQISEQVAKRSYFNVAKYPVGIKSRVQDVLEFLDVGGSDVRMVGIWGRGGIGKTTIAKAIFNSIRHKFERRCFLANVRAASASHQGLVGLQNDLLYQVLGEWKNNLTNADIGIEEIKGRLGSEDVLLVLDDVNELNQLEKLAGGLDWFGHGSRIIITTRDRGLLYSHQVKAIYTAETLGYHEARKLLILNAFKGNRKPDEFEESQIEAALLYAQGLPLAINILGSLLCGKSKNQWHATINYFTRFPNRDIQKVLETSYYELEYPLKEAFLDIACFLKGQDIRYVMQALAHFNPVHALNVLEEKALIYYDKDDRVSMDDLVEEMGKEIVRRESPNEAGSRSRIWFYKDVYHVLTENTGSNQVKGIRVELPTEDEIPLSAKCFKKMKNLQLFININARFSGEVHYLPSSLRFVDWPGFPAQSLPYDYNPKKLVNISMPNRLVSRLGQGLENLQNVTFLSFEGCEFLTEVPDLSGRFPNLESLNLNNCANLVELHPSVGFLDKLVSFELENCCNLKTFPRMVNMKSLIRINFSGCKRLENIPEIGASLVSLQYINLRGTAITEVPLSFEYHLHSLELHYCGNLTTLPLSVYELRQLMKLFLTSCPKVDLTPFSSKSNMSHYDSQIWSEFDVGQDNFAFPSPSVRDCESLESISKSSNILELEESQMFVWLDLRNCGALCDKLFSEAKKASLLAGTDDPQLETDLLSRFLSSLKSKFSVVLPARHEINKSLLNLEDFTKFRGNGRCLFHIQVLANFTWENTGLALCVVAEDAEFADVNILFNGKLVMNAFVKFDISCGGPNDSMWLLYIPFVDMEMEVFLESDYTRPVPPFKCQVNVFCSNITSLIWGGLYLVMPPNEACMQLFQ